MKLLLGILIVRPIMGFISMSIASNRGMEGGFGWGFFLGIIGIIVVAIRPNDNKQSTRENTKYSAQKSNQKVYDDLNKLKELREQGAITENEYEKMRQDLVRML